MKTRHKILISIVCLLAITSPILFYINLLFINHIKNMQGHIEARDSLIDLSQVRQMHMLRMIDSLNVANEEIAVSHERRK